MGSDMTDIISLVIFGGLAYYLLVGGGLQNISSVIPSVSGIISSGSSGGGGGASPGGTTKFSCAGDWGSGRNSNWKGVVAEMKKFKPNAVVRVGDFSYTDAGAFEPVIDGIKAFGAKNLGCEGNHDGGDYDSLFDNFSNSVVNIGNCSFMLLNTESGDDSITFAKANFSKMTQKWKIVAFHKPFYTAKSDHGGDNSVKDLEPEFEKAGVQLVLTGHNHMYNRFSPKNGVVYMVCGTGGESHYSSGGGTGIAEENDSDFGTTNFTATASSIKGQFVGVGGKIIDTFSITDSGKAAAYVRAYYARPRRSLNTRYL